MIRMLAMVATLVATLGVFGAMAKEPVEIAVRVDAKPFAWQDGSGAFRGFLVDLCREAVIRAGFLPVERAMTAKQRASIIEGSGAIDFDLMCDPTTISLERLQVLAGRKGEELVFSPILFVANGTYVSRPDYVRPLLAKDVAAAKSKGFVGTAYASMVAAIGSLAQDRPAEAPPSAKYALPEDCGLVRGAEQVKQPAGYMVAGYITGATARTVAIKAVNDPESPVPSGDLWVCLKEFDDHKSAVAAICGDRDAAGSIDLYFGDSDIIAAYRTGKCNVKPAPRPLSYEPYAVLVSDRTMGFREAFVRSLYELFSDGTVGKRFDTYFSGHSQSDPLQVLFRINSIPGLRN